MKFTQATKSRKRKNNPSRPDWGSIIKAKRIELGETQTEFGKRFQVTHVAVGYWEKNLRDVPDRVTWWLTHNDKD